MNRVRSVQDTPGTLRHRIVTVVSTALAADAAAVTIDTLRTERSASLRQLDEHLAQHPDALLSTDPRCPLAHVRLTRALWKAGFAVGVPGCSGCRRSEVELPFTGTAGRICRRCYIAANQKTCARCGRTVRIAARRPDGVICKTCYQHDPAVAQTCGGCGRVKPPSVRREDGSTLCDSCRPRLERVCTSCGTVGPASLGPDGAFCRRCYQRDRVPRRVCGRCGKQRPIAHRATADTPDICTNCSGLLPPEACGVCGNVRVGYRHAVHGFVCRWCREPKTACSCCGLLRRAVTRSWPIGPVCTTCYTRIVDHPAVCRGCGTRQPLIARAADGVMTCGPCAGQPGTYRCTSCVNGGRLSPDGRCPACVLPERVRAHLAGPDGPIPVQLQPVAEALTTTDNAQTVLNWLARSPNAHLLARLAAAGEHLTHDLLDELPQNNGEFYLRQALVSTGVLPARNEDLERIPAWLEHLLADKPSRHARLIRPYVHWFLLRRARRRAATVRRTGRAGSFLRHQIRLAAELTAWLDARQLTLEHLQQHDLEAWLVSVGVRGYDVRSFLGWAADRGAAPRLLIPPAPQKTAGVVLDDKARWEQLHRCVNDTDMPLDVRAAGALVLLYGLPVIRILELTTDAIHERDGTTLLSVGSQPLLIPPKLAHLLRRLPAPATKRLFVTSGSNPPWLFPGHTPGRAANPSVFTGRLNAHGIAVRPARRAALIALVSDIPAPVLAGLAGLHPNTAAKWATIAQRDWTAYLSARAADQRQHQAERRAAGPEH